MIYALSVIVAIFILLVFITKYDQIKYRKLILTIIEENFGKPREVEEDMEQEEYSERYMEHLTFYTRIHEEELDEITKNDVMFTELFMKINHTYSAVGEEYLYYLLSNPIYNSDILQKREEYIQYFQDHQEKAKKLQLYFANIGKSNNVSIFQYLEYIKSVNVKPLYKHCVSFMAFVMTVIFACIIPQLGVVPMLVVLAINVITYWSNRQYAQGLMGNIKNIEDMIVAAQEFRNLEGPIFNRIVNTLGQSRQIKDVFKGSAIAFSDKAMNVMDANALFDYVRMLTHIDYVLLLRIMKKVNNRFDELYRIAECLGELESMIAIASFRESLPYYTVPKLNKVEKVSNCVKINGQINQVIDNNYQAIDMTGINAKDLYHPLIKDAIANSIEVRCGVLLTGSNASGKSTFLRTVAINAICAQTIHTCFATAYMSDYYKVRSAMSLQDSLENGDSYFVVEIDTIKSIIDDESEVPILCFVDEVLRGTNTIERIAAATEILRYMIKKGIICFAASHDIELTKLLADQYDMYHFQEYINNGLVEFDYILYPGAVTTRNAIRLLEAKGYEQIIVNNAIDLVDYFEKHGEWPIIYRK